MPKSAGYVNAEFLQKAAERVKHLKQRTYEWMDIKTGDHVLDVGCGPGMDTVALAALVGPDGKVTGLDIDEEMLVKADAFAKEQGVKGIVEHRYGDVIDMPFRENAFDSIRAERLFQVLPGPYDRPTVFQEMVRVTKPGGMIVLADTDWATASVNFENSELERRLMTFFALKMRPNGFAGRQFYQMFMQKHLSEVQIEHFPMVMTDLEETPFGEWLKQEAVLANIATEAEMDLWTRQLSELSKTGQFYSSANMVIVAGRKSINKPD
ncbi:methyltransferase domain-containing protein [bacterium]|nr:methyltransferase domain-containing protein [bacterium]